MPAIIANVCELSGHMSTLQRLFSCVKARDLFTIVLERVYENVRHQPDPSGGVVEPQNGMPGAALCAHARCRQIYRDARRHVRTLFSVPIFAPHGNKPSRGGCASTRDARWPERLMGCYQNATRGEALDQCAVRIRRYHSLFVM